MLGNTAGFVVAADHEAGDVLQEDQRGVALVAQFDEVRALLRGFAEQHTVVGDDAHGVPIQVGKTGHKRCAVFGFEFMELAAVDQTGDDFADVVRGFEVSRHHLGEFVRAEQRFARFPARPRRGEAFLRGQGGHDIAHDLQGVLVIGSQVVGDTRGA